MSFRQKISNITKNKSFKYGVPFLITIVGGSFGLKEFTQLKYQFNRKPAVSPEDMKKYGVTMKKSGEVTIDTEYEKIKNIDIDTWENKRGPRPWEETNGEDVTKLASAAS